MWSDWRKRKSEQKQERRTDKNRWKETGSQIEKDAKDKAGNPNKNSRGSEKGNKGLESNKIKIVMVWEIWKNEHRLNKSGPKKNVCKKELWCRREEMKERKSEEKRKGRERESKRTSLLFHPSCFPLLIEAFISLLLLMWLIEQISRKQKANCVRPAILRHLLCKYYPWILVLETHIYIKHESERCQPQLAPASVYPEGGLRRNSSACVLLHDFPPEAIPGEQRGEGNIL